MESRAERSEPRGWREGEVTKEWDSGGGSPVKGRSRRLQECLAALFAAADEAMSEADPSGLETYGEGVDRVSQVLVRDNGEPLVNVADFSLGY